MTSLQQQFITVMYASRNNYCRNDSHELVVYLQFVTAFTVVGDMCWVPAFKYEFYVCKIGRTLVEIDMLVAVFWLVAGTSVCLAQPEYTTPGGILTTNCMKGCTEIAVHESNCCKYTLIFFFCISNFGRSVLIPRLPLVIFLIILSTFNSKH